MSLGFLTSHRAARNNLRLACRAMDRNPIRIFHTVGRGVRLSEHKKPGALSLVPSITVAGLPALDVPTLVHCFSSLFSTTFWCH